MPESDDLLPKLRRKESSRPPKPMTGTRSLGYEKSSLDGLKPTMIQPSQRGSDRASDRSGSRSDPQSGIPLPQKPLLRQRLPLREDASNATWSSYENPPLQELSRPVPGPNPRPRPEPLTRPPLREAAGRSSSNGAARDRRRAGVEPSPRREARKRTQTADSRSLTAKTERTSASRKPVARRTRSPKARRALGPGFTMALYAMRLAVLSIGVGVLAGTTLSALDPSSRAPAGASQKAAVVKPEATSSPAAPSPNLPQGTESPELKAAVQKVLAESTPRGVQMAPSLFFMDLDSNSYVDVNGAAAMSAASTIKFPILIAFLQDVDAGKIRLDESLVIRKDLIGGGSGDMQYKPVGTRFSALETATKMMTISDNTATNLLIARLGGITSLNERFKSWGLTTTVINNLLPDLEGTNTTSAKEMASLMMRVSQGDLISSRSRDRLMDVMRQTTNNGMLPPGLGPGARIAHKTGDIGGTIGDVGVIDMPSGKRYVAAVLVKRPHNDDRAYDLIQQISRTIYQYFNRPVPAAPAGQGTPRAEATDSESLANNLQRP